jgi:hypothetical protein
MARTHRALKILAFYTDGNVRQACELRKQLQEIEISITF